MLRNIIFSLFLVLTLSNVAAAQDTVVTKAYIQSLEERVQRLESTTGANELFKERLDLINDKIENLQTESQISSAGVANQIAASSNYLSMWGIVFGLILFGVGAYITVMQNRTAKYLQESKEVLASQRSIENEVINAKKVMEDVQGNVDVTKREVEDTRKEVKATQEMINNNLSELYLRLQAEEVNYLIDKVYQQPYRIYQLYDRFSVLWLTKEHFRRLGDFIILRDEVGETRVKDTIFNIILNQFPETWLQDRKLKEYFVEMNSWIRVIKNYDYQSVKRLVDSLLVYMANKKPEEIDYKIGSVYLEKAYKLYEAIVGNRIVPSEVRDSLPDRKLTKYFYERLGCVDNYSSSVMAAARCRNARKLEAVLSYRVAMR
ncbi:hypothetical protein, partial [Pontibacter brevis]